MTGLFLRQVVLVAEGLEEAVAQFRAVLGIDVAYSDPQVGQFGLVNAILPIGRQFLEVIAPTTVDAPARRFLDRRGGAGGYDVILQTDDQTPHRKRVDELGIRVVLDFTDGDFTCLQLHPADIGGSMLEIDEQPGGPDGPWHPAGDDWASAVRTECVLGVSGVRVQSDSPFEVARRWADVLLRPVVGDGDDARIELDNSTIRFVPDADGRGPGLSGIELTVRDASAVVGAATVQGLPVTDTNVVLCGTTFVFSDGADGPR